MLKAVSVISPKFLKLREDWSKDLCTPLDLYKRTYETSASQLKVQTETHLPELVRRISKIYSQILEYRDRMENPNSPQKTVDASSSALIELVKQKQPLEANFYGRIVPDQGATQEVASQLVLTLRGDTSRAMMRMCRGLEQVAASPIFAQEGFSLADQEKHLRQNGHEQLRAILADLKISGYSNWDGNWAGEGPSENSGEKDGLKVSLQSIPSQSQKNYANLQHADSAISLYEVAVYDHFTFIPPSLVDSYSDSFILSRTQVQDGCKLLMGLFKGWNSIRQSRSADPLKESSQIVKKYFEGVGYSSNQSPSSNLTLGLLQLTENLNQSFKRDSGRNFIAELHLVIFQYIHQQLKPSKPSQTDYNSLKPPDIHALLTSSQNLQKSSYPAPSTSKPQKTVLEECISLVFLLSANLQWTSFWQCLTRETSNLTKPNNTLSMVPKHYRPVSFHHAKTEAIQFGFLLRQAADPSALRGDVGHVWELLLKRIERIWAVAGSESNSDLDSISKNPDPASLKLDQSSGLCFPLNILVAQHDHLTNQDSPELIMLSLSPNTRILLRCADIWTKTGKKAFLRLISVKHQASNSDCTQALENSKTFLVQSKQLLHQADLSSSDPTQMVLARSIASEMCTFVSKLSILNPENNSILTGVLCNCAFLLRLAGVSITSGQGGQNQQQEFPRMVSAIMAITCNVGAATWKCIITKFGYKSADKSLNDLHGDDALSETVCTLYLI